MTLVKDIPKVDLHVHLEGTITPTMARHIAEKNKLRMPPMLLKVTSGHFTWPDNGTPQDALVSFLKVYDEATMVMRTEEDYTTITYDYLQRTAREGCIYAEIIISADHGRMIGLTYKEMVNAIAKGCEQAKKKYGIETRLLSACVRHFGPQRALDVAAETKAYKHPLVTGFTMAGDENTHKAADFLPAFEASGLANRNAHAGEAAGPQSIRDVMTHLKVRRFGHMVRAVEDEALIEELKAVNAVPEVCVSSNIALKIYDSYTTHPLRKLFDYGFKITLGSDDPSFFGTSIGREYRLAHENCKFKEEEMMQITRNALEEAFVDEETRGRLLSKLEPKKVKKA